MKQLWIAILLLAISSSAWGIGPTPKFTKTALTANSDGSATFYWIESKLKDESRVTYTLQPEQVSTFWCVTGNAGSYVIQGQPLTFTLYSLFGSGLIFPVVGRGTVEASFYVDTHDSTGTFSCPTGQNLVLSCVAYHGASIVDSTNNVSGSFPDAVVNILPQVNSQSPIGCQ